MYKFKPLLTEGNVYIMSYFGVTSNGGSFRTTRHEYCLNFQYKTIVCNSECDNIHHYGCKLIGFNEILQSDIQSPYLIDTVGLLTGVGSENEYQKRARQPR